MRAFSKKEPLKQGQLYYQLNSYFSIAFSEQAQLL